MAVVAFARALIDFSYTVTQVDPPLSETYTYLTGQAINSPNSSVYYNSAMLDDDPLFAEGKLVILTLVHGIKFLNEVSYTNNSIDYSFGTAEVYFDPPSSIDSGFNMFTDDPLILNGTCRVALKEDFAVPPLIDPLNNVFLESTMPLAGKVRGIAFIQDKGVMAHYLWYFRTDRADEYGPSVLIVYTDQSITYLGPV